MKSVRFSARGRALRRLVSVAGAEIGPPYYAIEK